MVVVESGRFTPSGDPIFEAAAQQTSSQRFQEKQREQMAAAEQPTVFHSPGFIAKAKAAGITLKPAMTKSELSRVISSPNYKAFIARVERVEAIAAEKARQPPTPTAQVPLTPFQKETQAQLAPTGIKGRFLAAESFVRQRVTEPIGGFLAGKGITLKRVGGFIEKRASTQFTPIGSIDVIKLPKGITSKFKDIPILGKVLKKKGEFEAGLFTGFVKEVKEKPLQTAALVGVGFVAPPVFRKIGQVTKVILPKVSPLRFVVPTAKVALGAAFVLPAAVEFIEAKTPKLKGEVIGRKALQVTALGAGAKLHKGFAIRRITKAVGVSEIERIKQPSGAILETGKTVQTFKVGGKQFGVTGRTITIQQPVKSFKIGEIKLPRGETVQLLKKPKVLTFKTAALADIKVFEVAPRTFKPIGKPTRFAFGGLGRAKAGKGFLDFTLAKPKALRVSLQKGKIVFVSKKIGKDLFKIATLERIPKKPISTRFQAGIALAERTAIIDKRELFRIVGAKQTVPKKFIKAPPVFGIGGLQPPLLLKAPRPTFKLLTPTVTPVGQAAVKVSLKQILPSLIKAPSPLILAGAVRIATKPLTIQKTIQPVKVKQITKITAITKPIQIPKLITTPSQVSKLQVTPTTALITTPSQVSKTFIPTPTQQPIPFVPLPTPPLGLFPLLGGGSSARLFFKKLKLKRPTKFQPSLVGIVKKRKKLKRKFLTGLEVRGIPKLMEAFKF